MTASFSIFNNGDTVNHKLILVEGKLNWTTGNEVTLSGISDNSISLCIFNSTANSPGVITGQSETFSELRFIGLVDLNFGGNHLILSAQLGGGQPIAEHSFTVTYQPVSAAEVLEPVLLFAKDDERIGDSALSRLLLRKLTFALQILQAILSNVLLQATGVRKTFYIGGAITCLKHSDASCVVPLTLTREALTSSIADRDEDKLYWACVRDILSVNNKQRQLLVAVLPSAVPQQQCSNGVTELEFHRTAGDVALLLNKQLDSWPETLSELGDALVAESGRNETCSTRLSYQSVNASSIQSFHTTVAASSTFGMALSFENGTTYETSFSASYGWQLGALLHELGHLFQLGHNSRSLGVMGSEFPRIQELLFQIPPFSSTSAPFQCFDVADVAILSYCNAFNAGCPRAMPSVVNVYVLNVQRLIRPKPESHNATNYKSGLPYCNNQFFKVYNNGNDKGISEASDLLYFNTDTLTLVSRVGLAVIQTRNARTGAVLASLRLDEIFPPKTYLSCAELLAPSQLAKGASLLFAIDLKGTVLKVQLHFSDFPDKLINEEITECA